ncbi:MAG: FecR domain-containing protein [Sphingobacterium sp.]|jgi:ferric-dicitrate binding protein FerR (iron transport regulator)|nr:FecR domain-containing protein [Sphingobacterium sp.]
MDDQNQGILDILAKYEDGRITESELQELEEWYASFEANPDLIDSLSPEERAFRKQQLQERIFDQLGPETSSAAAIPKKRFFPYPSHRLWQVAASLILLCTVSFYMFKKQSDGQPASLTAQSSTINPGTDQATLTLGNGEQILLDDSKNGELSAEGNIHINKLKPGNLVYTASKKVSKIHSNTLATPRGGRYQLTLADGTQVWLNAQSSITYPSAFQGSSREVTISGEVYFEVAHNATMPFRVRSENQLIEVLGTHFNVNTYNAKSRTKTTLLSGSIALTNTHQRIILKPGEQGIVAGHSMSVKNVDPAEVIAWKEGYFDFTDADISSVIDELGRWYNVDIHYQGTTTPETFTGRIPRSWPFEKVLNLLKTFKSIQVEMQGRRLIVKTK